ncbi:uncharacterized protein LOC143003013 [Genypterus blacodes]|uniref:uncharacterized protein LOC143003013 n=1 Tax=Genypterus blacodes TaxID=154954 RepID=UPI003F76C6A6
MEPDRAGGSRSETPAREPEDGTGRDRAPWPYLSTFMSLKRSTDKTYTFECNLCKPKMKTLSTSKTSSTNLRTHIQRVHPVKMEELRIMQLQKRNLSNRGSEEASFAAAQMLERADPGEEDACREPWPYLSKFMSLKYSTDKTYTFECNLCKPIMKTLSTSKTSSTNLRTHIRRMHPGKMEELRIIQLQKRKLSTSSTSNSSEEAASWSSPVHYFMRDVTTVSQAKFNRLILNFVIQGLHPLSVVEQPEFQELFREVLPSRHVMSRKTLIRMLEEEFTSMKSNLCRILSKQTFVATSTDAWCVNQRSYLGVTTHWIDPHTLTVSSGALACRRIKGKQTYDNLARMLESIHREFGIQNKVVLTTTDNGSNFIKAFSVLAAEEEDREVEEEEDEGEEVEFTDLTAIFNGTENQQDFHLPAHQRCACHSLHLVAIQDAEGAATNVSFKKTSRATFAKCRSLWIKQSRSTQASDIITNTLGCMLVLPNVLQWNSVFNAMEDLKTCIEEKPQEFDDVCDQLDLPRLKPAEVTFIKEYVVVMGPLFKALDVLQSDKMAYLGILVPTIAILVENLQTLKQASLQCCAPLVNAVLRGVETRFGYLSGKKYLMATASHPMFRLSYVPHQQKDEIISSLKQVLQILPDSGFADPTEAADEEVNDEGDAVVAYFSKRQDILITDEVDSFLQSSDTSPVSAFQNLPKMKRLFIKCNTGIPASAACPQAFTAGRDVCLPKSNRLSDNNFEKLLMCRINKSFCFTSHSAT